ncbi:MAG TPA: phasin family protein [Sphingomonas sp.]|uniref:phasin family protein n=1 Tax=Sphingomonas sp. TaxID=28214 RepID=UPI002ED94967
MADDDQNTNQGAAMGASAGAAAGTAAGGAADRMREGAQKAQAAFGEQVIEPARRAGEAMRASGQKVAENSSQIGVKMIDQAETNTHQAFDAMRRAAQAKDLSEVMKIQGEYLREQSTRSMTQAREIGELIMQFGRDAVGGMRGGGQG